MIFDNVLFFSPLFARDYNHNNIIKKVDIMMDNVTVY